MMQVELKDSMGTDLTVVNTARVSFNKEVHSMEERDVKLLSYLAKHKHWSPFSHCFLQFYIKAPIFVARQLAKHQVGLAWNEVSRRYIDSEPEFYVPNTWRTRPEKSIKQGSGDKTVDYDIQGTMLFVQQTYNNLLKEGIAPEMARMVLPQNTMTEWYWSGSLYSFARICKLRLDKTAQVEVREIASPISKKCLELFPHSWTALMENKI